MIQQLLAEAGHAGAREGSHGAGHHRRARRADGYRQGGDSVRQKPISATSGRRTLHHRAARRKTKAHTYTAPAQPALNDWGSRRHLEGRRRARDAGRRVRARIVYRFHARDLHLVLGPGQDGRPVRFRVTIDGAAPGERAHGIRRGCGWPRHGHGAAAVSTWCAQSGKVADRTFAIEFLDAGVEAYAFTFG
ncbi:hypothetical protein ACU4GD_11545 [Cupriavidus basilensis]